MEKIFVNLFKTDRGFKGEGMLNNRPAYFYSWATSPEKFAETGVAYWTSVYFSQEDFNKKMAWDRDIKSDLMAGIKEKNSDKGVWYGGMLFDNANKKAYFVNLYNNDTPAPGKDHDKMLVVKETEYRERPLSGIEATRAAVETEAPF